MKKNTSIVIVLLIAMSLAFANMTFAAEVDVETDFENINNIAVVTGGGDGHDKYRSGAYMGMFEGMYPGTPNIPITKGSLWSLKEAKRVFLALPEVITSGMVEVYFGNKTKLVDGKYEKEALAKAFAKAQKYLLKTANVVVMYDLPATNAVRPWAKYPGKYAKKGVDYFAMGSITFKTREGFEKWYRSLKLENISSDDLGIMICKASMILGADFIVPTGEGAEVMFGTEAKGVNLGALLSGALSLSGSNALPVGGSLGGALSGTSGSNGLKANPFLSVALVKVINPDNVRISLGIQEPKNAIPAAVTHVEKEVVSAPAKELSLKKDHYLTLAMCALPVPSPNGRTRLQVAQIELDKYMASKRTDLKPLSIFQSHLAQAIRDNIRGENLKLARMGVALAWLERADVIKRVKEKGIITEEEFSKAYIDNLMQVEKVMKRYKIKAVTSLGTYADQLDAASKEKK